MPGDQHNLPEQGEYRMFDHECIHCVGCLAMCTRCSVCWESCTHDAPCVHYEMWMFSAKYLSIHQLWQLEFIGPWLEQELLALFQSYCVRKDWLNVEVRQMWPHSYVLALLLLSLLNV